MRFTINRNTDLWEAGSGCRVDAGRLGESATSRGFAWCAMPLYGQLRGIEDAEHPLIIDLDATLVTAHSDKESAAPTFKRG